MKGKYFLDVIDGIYEDPKKTLHSTNSYTLYNFYHSLCYGRPFPGELDDTALGIRTNWDIITFNNRVLMKRVNGQFVDGDP